MTTSLLLVNIYFIWYKNLRKEDASIAKVFNVGFFLLMYYSKTFVTEAEKENNFFYVIFFREIEMFKSLQIRGEKKKLTIKMIYCY